MSKSATIQSIDHINLDVPAEHLNTVSQFYSDAVGLTEGFRPDFDFDGRWLYASGIERAVLHLASYGANDTAPLHQSTGRFNHVCFAMQGLAAHREKLQNAGTEFKESNRPNAEVVQLFLTDPTGVMVELNFSKAAEGLPLPETVS
ncbi:MAG: VOC family protein [Burkholderiaceae bacterium]